MELIQGGNEDAIARAEAEVAEAWAVYQQAQRKLYEAERARVPDPPLPEGLRLACTGDYARVLYEGRMVAPDGVVRREQRWEVAVPDVFGRLRTCVDSDCELIAGWRVTYWGCSSPWCGKHPGHPLHRVGGSTFCLAHARERGLVLDEVGEVTERRGRLRLLRSVG